jgi:outer membrane lipoprotein-sorting protein
MSSERILALALERGTGAMPGAEEAHVRDCAECAARLAKVLEQLGQVERAMTWFDRDHAAERERLLAAVAGMNDRSSRRDRSVTRTWKEVLTMPRTWIGSAAAAALLAGIFFFWNGTGTAPLLAQTAQALRDVKSYRCRVTTIMNLPDGKQGESLAGTWYWAAPGSIRMDTYRGKKLIEVEVQPQGKAGLRIDHRSETFARLEPNKGSAALSPLLVMGKLAAFAGQADRTLDKQVIGGVTAPGFEIALAKVDPDVGDGTLRLWIDPKSKLPVRMEMNQDSGRMVFEDFQWNVPAEQWFRLEPPAGYQDKTPTPSPADEVTKHIVTGLKTYEKYCGGRYPQVTRVYGDVTSEELNRNAGLPPRSPPTDKALDKVYWECSQAWPGFGHMNVLQRQDAGAIYHGKTVGPQDKNKVLFRWTLPDGQFRVIYGDLHHEDVDAARLKKLEAN